MRTCLTPSILLVFCAQVAASDKCARTPESAAQVLYEKHQEFIFSGASSPPLSKAFSKAVNASLAEQQRTGDSGPIDWNYWTDAQDGEQSTTAKPVRVTAKGKRAQVQLAYEFFPSPSERPRPMQALITLERGPQGCWLVADVQRNKRSVMSYLQPQK